MSEDEKNQIENLFKLNLNPELLQLVTDAFPFLISYVDRNQTYRFHNKEYEKMFGRQHDAIQGKHVKDVLGKETYELVKPYINRALSGERVRFESLIHYNDMERFMDVQYIPDVGANNEVLGFIAIVHYVSERKKSGNPVRKFDIRFNELMSTLIELTCQVEDVRIRLNETYDLFEKEEHVSEKVNALLKKWNADLKASENMVLNVKQALVGWIEKNKEA